MATMAQVENILVNAKHGQYVVPSCPGTSESLEGYVVNLDPENLQAVKIGDWTQGWPEDQPQPSGNDELIFKYKHGIGTYVGQEYGQDWEFFDDGDKVTVPDAVYRKEIDHTTK